MAGGAALAGVIEDTEQVRPSVMTFDDLVENHARYLAQVEPGAVDEARTRLADFLEDAGGEWHPVPTEPGARFRATGGLRNGLNKNGLSRPPRDAGTDVQRVRWVRTCSASGTPRSSYRERACLKWSSASASSPNARWA